MSDFLRDLVGRTLGVRDVLRPRPGSALKRSDASGHLWREPEAHKRLVERAAAPALRPATPDRRSPPVPASPREPAPEPVVSRISEPTATAIPVVQPAEPAVAATARAPEPTPLEPQTQQTAEPHLRELPPGAAPQTAPRRPTDVVTAAPPATPAQETPTWPEQSGPVKAPEPPELPQPAAPRAAAVAGRADLRVVERAVAAREPSGARERTAAPTPRARRRTVEPPASESEPEPVVHVHIGRIEVRAPAAPARPQAPRPREPSLSLADYLAQTSTRRR